MDLKPGTRCKSAVCNAEVVIIRPPKRAVVLECGGHPMMAMTAERPTDLAISPNYATGIQLGKRYCDEEIGIEVLASKAGQGSLSINGKVLSVRNAKALPSSD